MIDVIDALAFTTIVTYLAGYDIAMQYGATQPDGYTVSKAPLFGLGSGADQAQYLAVGVS